METCLSLATLLYDVQEVRHVKRTSAYDGFTGRYVPSFRHKAIFLHKNVPCILEGGRNKK